MWPCSYPTPVPPHVERDRTEESGIAGAYTIYMILTTEGLGHPPFRIPGMSDDYASGVTTVVDQGLM